MQYIRHITIDTGHCRDSYRDEISDDALRACQSLIQHCQDYPAPQDIPGTDCKLKILRMGRCMSAVVQAADEMPLVTIGVAARSRCAEKLWTLLHARYASGPGTMPDAPWCAVLLRDGLAHHPAESLWLGDFERCLAWAWVGK